MVADSADVLVVAPATARWLGSMANGIASDTVTAACLATSAPVVVAPAMDGDMWLHRATRDNAARLERDFGYRIVPPEIGSLASGQSGIGRLADLPLIVDAVVAAVAEPARSASRTRPRDRLPSGPAASADLVGRHVVVSAGGTAEAIDPVRFIGNRSTGRMGARSPTAALDRGARVTIVAGRVEVPLPSGAVVVRAESTAAMRDRRASTPSSTTPPTRWSWPRRSPTSGRGGRRTRSSTRGEGLTLELEPTEDILAEVGVARPRASRPGPSSSGSRPRPAPWTGRRRSSAARAPTSSSPTTSRSPGSGFGTDTNRVVILAADGSRDDLPLLTKREVADRLLDRVVAALDERDAGAHTAVTMETTR